MRHIIVLLIAVTCSLPAQAQEAREVQRANHYLDHVVLAINDLDEGIEAFYRLTGVNPKKDGSDARAGTHSAIVGLDDSTFLEIVAPDPKADPDSVDPELRELVLDPIRRLDALTPFQWYVGTSNMERTQLFARRAGSRYSEMAQGSRKRGWGRQQQWSWFRITIPESRVSPWFVQWQDENKRPQERAPGGCMLEYLQVNSRTFKSVHALAATMQVDADVEGADDESIMFELECPQGEVVFGPTTLYGTDNWPDSGRN